MLPPDDISEEHDSVTSSLISPVANGVGLTCDLTGELGAHPGLRSSVGLVREADLLIFSDGSSGSPVANNRPHSSAACTLRFRRIPDLPPLKIVALTQLIRSHDAELIAAVIGLAAFRMCVQKHNLAAEKILLASDCTYVIRLVNLSRVNLSRANVSQSDRSANCGISKRKRSYIEQLFGMLCVDLDIKAHHVRGHSGHAGNEACHRACAWVNAQSDKLLASYGEGALGRLSRHSPGQAWNLIDLRAIDLRGGFFDGRPDSGQSEALVRGLEGLNCKLFSVVESWLNQPVERISSGDCTSRV